MPSLLQWVELKATGRSSQPLILIGKKKTEQKKDLKEGGGLKDTSAAASMKKVLFLRRTGRLLYE